MLHAAVRWLLKQTHTLLDRQAHAHTHLTCTHAQCREWRRGGGGVG